MSFYPFFFHPATILVCIVAIIVVLVRNDLRFSWVGAAAMLLASVANPLLWLLASPYVLGFTLGGLGGWIYLYAILPVNGALAALAAGLISETVMKERPTKRRVTIMLFTIAVTLSGNLVLARFAEYLAGNLRG